MHRPLPRKGRRRISGPHLLSHSSSTTYPLASLAPTGHGSTIYPAPSTTAPPPPPVVELT
jgi:hypothetical protein